MTKANYNKLIKNTIKHIKEIGGIQIDYALFDFSFDIETRTNKITISLEKYEKGSKIFSIYGMFNEKPEGEINSKEHLHLFIDAPRIEAQIRYHLNHLLIK